jgi:hypothetical protein
VYTLYNSQQLSLFSSSEDPGSNCCNQLLWHPLPSLVITDSELSDHGCRRPSYIAREQTTKKTPSPIQVKVKVKVTLRPTTSRSVSPGFKAHEGLTTSTVLWRHYRTGPQRKQQFLPLLRCLATVVNRRFHCWLLTYSVHVTLYIYNVYGILLYGRSPKDGSGAKIFRLYPTTRPIYS